MSTRFKTKAADTIYNQMIKVTASDTADNAEGILQMIQGYTAEQQLLGLASTLLFLTEQYRIETTDVLSEAHNKVFSGEYNNLAPEFEVLKNYIKERWELSNDYKS
jgi:hypothetical protein